VIPRARLALATALLVGFSPFEAEEENVREGNAALRAGDPAEALRRYDAAERELGPRAEVEHDRAHAHLRAGRKEEAKAAWRRAAETAPPALASRALQNLGTALAEEGDEKGAARAFADALEKDPSNEDARWNLEVVLRREKTPQPTPTPNPNPTPTPNPSPSPTPTPTPTPPTATPDPEPAADRHPDRAPPIPREQAEALLDALRAREKRMPFSGRERREGRRGDAAKDW
jgi:tetratricopeptide (TPR) repeat protein